MSSRLPPVFVAVWTILAAALALAAPGRIDAPLCFFPWTGHATHAHLLGPGTPWAVARAFLLVAGAFCIGRVLASAGSSTVRWLGLHRAEGVSRGSVAFLLGAGACGGAFLGLGLAGLFHPALLVAAAAGMAAAGRRGGMPHIPRLPLPPVPVLAALAYLALQFVPYWFCPETDQDALNFHLALPERFLRLHRVVLDPLTASAYAFRPAPIDLLYALPVAVAGDALARLLHGLFLLAGVSLVFRFVERRVGGTAAWLAVVLCLAPVSLGNVAARAKNDLAAAACALGAWLVWIDGPRSPARTVTAAALAGCAVSAKLTAAALVVPWVACAVGGVVATPALAAGRWRKVGALVALAALPLLPWLARNWIVAGDPVYPHLSPGWFGGLAWTEGNRDLNAAVYHFMSYRDSSPAGTVAGLLRLDVPFLLVLVPVFVLLRGRFAVTAVAAAAAYAAAVVVQPAARYGIPAAWLLVAVAVPALGALPAAMSGIMRAGLVLLAVVPAFYRFPAAETMADDRARWWSPWAYIAGGESGEEFLSARLGSYRTMTLALPGLVPPGRTVLLHHDARSYRLPRPSLRGQEDADDPVLRRLSRESASPRDLSRKLRQLNAGALAINPVIAYRYLAESHPLGWDVRSLRVYGDFMARRVSAVWNSPTEDDLNGAYCVIVLGPRSRAPGPVPMLPGTAPAWARAGWRMASTGGVPDPEVEAELESLVALLPGVGEAWFRLGNYRFVTGNRTGAASAYRRALASGYIEGILLARLSTCLSPGREREGFISRLRARCGPEADSLLAEAAKWVK